MIKHLFTCPNCGAKMEYKLFQLSATVKCESCGKQYIVNKNRMILMIEVVLLVVLSFLLREGVQAKGIDNYVLEIGLVIFMLLAVNAILDVLFTHVIKWKKYFTLIEKMIQK